MPAASPGFLSPNVSPADQIAALRSIISAWLRLAIFQTMTEGEGDKKLWFVVDELDAFGPIDGLKDALARLRKFGGRCVLGFQSIAQVSSTYGYGEAQTIVENCSNCCEYDTNPGNGAAHEATIRANDPQAKIERYDVSP